MQYLFLHIGREKTGSSAIQSWLANNANRLTAQGFSYTVNDTESLHHRISSGNGRFLQSYLLGRSDVEGVLNHYFNHTCPNTIISSELLPMEPESLEKLKAFCKQQKIHLKVIAYLRNPIDLFYSKYVQKVKRHNYLESFEHFCREIPFHTHIKIAERIDRHLEDIELIHYNEHQDDIVAPFCEVIGTHASEFEQPRKVNRSITFSEITIIQLFARWREKHFGDLDTSKVSRIISDWLVNNFPERKSEIVINKAVIEAISRKCADQIAEFNSSLGKRFGLSISIDDSTNYDNLVFDEQRSEIDVTILRDVSTYLASKEALIEPECLTVFADELREVDPQSFEILSRS